MSSVLQFLSQGKCQTLRLALQTQLHVITGRLWVTMADDITDYFVESGQSLVLQSTLVTLQADSPQATIFAMQEKA